jgi:hypothetical protein
MPGAGYGSVFGGESKFLLAGENNSLDTKRSIELDNSKGYNMGGSIAGVCGRIIRDGPEYDQIVKQSQFNTNSHSGLISGAQMVSSNAHLGNQVWREPINVNKSNINYGHVQSMGQSVSGHPNSFNNNSLIYSASNVPHLSPTKINL